MSGAARLDNNIPQARRTRLRRALPLWLLYAAVLAFTLGPLLLLGKDAALPLLDWLDGDITGKVLLGRNLHSVRDYFSPTVPQMMQGAAMWGNAPSTLLYAWFAPFTAYVLECFCAVSAAYWGMALFLRRGLAVVLGAAGYGNDGAHAANPATYATPLLCALVAAIFSCLPFYTVHDMNAMGIPLLLWALLVLWQAGAGAGVGASTDSRTQDVCGVGTARDASCASGVSVVPGSSDASGAANIPVAPASPSAARNASQPACSTGNATDADACRTLFPCEIPRPLLFAAYAAVVVYAACSTLAFTGYFVLGFLLLFLLVQLVRRRARSVHHLTLAFALALGVYLAANLGLVRSLFGLDAGGFVSHRTVYNIGTLAEGEVLPAFFELLLHGQYHAGSKHLLILTFAVLLLAVLLPFWRRLSRTQRTLWGWCAGFLGAGAGIAAFYAFCGTALYARCMALLGTALSSFQLDRLYFLYPTLWYTLLACALVLGMSVCGALAQTLFARGSTQANAARSDKTTAAGVTPPHPLAARTGRVLPHAFCAVALAACFAFVLRGNYQTDNWRAVLTGAQPENAVTWRQFFAEDAFAQLRAALSDGTANVTLHGTPDSATPDGGTATRAQPLRVASIGLSPAIALYNGFFTVDGYSNNYALPYHTAFGAVLRGELEQDAALASYYYDWGNRCYLFTAQLGRDFVYRRAVPTQPLQPLKFDWAALRALGCTHVLSIAPLSAQDAAGMDFVGKFADKAYDVYAYALRA